MASHARWAALVFVVASGCGGPGEPVRVEDYHTKLVTLPDGTQIRAEMVVAQIDLEKGLKYRDSLPADRGMLFVYGKPGFYRYWMHEVKIPLDILWLDSNRKIVQLVHDVPPCPGPPEKCPVYGGAFEAQYVLEINAGLARKYGIKPGMLVGF